VQLKEFSSQQLELEPEDLAYLLDLVHGSSAETDDSRLLQALTPTRVAGLYELRAGPFVGRLGLPSGRWIDFVSRFDFQDVIELIRVSGRTPIRTDLLRAEASSASFIVDAVAVAFTREVERLLGQGLAKGYQRQRFLRPPYPGRIDAAFHVGRLAARPDRLATVAKRLTNDVLLNQVLGQALEVLTRVPLDPGIARRVAHLMPAFTRISKTSLVADAVSRIPMTALSKRYESALGLAEVILRSQSTAPRSTGLAGGSILFHMPKVWEGYVAASLRNLWPDDEVISPYRFPLTNDGQHAEADMVVLRSGQLIALYDAKYKWPDSAPTRADLYQMVTYCDRLGLQEATLVYPVATSRRTVGVGNKTITVLGLTPATGDDLPTVSYSDARSGTNL
jgi:5-methylcytosine-specific restriction endonuclease McrBC regulatory subunit McrC